MTGVMLRPEELERKKFQLETEIQAEEPKVIKVYEASSCECNMWK